MKAAVAAERARAELAAGKEKAALRLAWAAIRERESDPAAAAYDVAEALTRSDNPKIAKDAGQLSAYCLAILDGVGGGVNAPNVVDRLFRRGGGKEPKRMRCPMCAEDIAAEAKICRHCGHVLVAG